MADDIDERIEDDDSFEEDDVEIVEVEAVDEEDEDEGGLEFEEFPGEDFVEDIEVDYDDDDDALIDDSEDDDDSADIDEILEAKPRAPKLSPSPKRKIEEEEDDEEDEEDEDVEASLDDILKERLVVAGDDEDDDDDDDDYDETDDRADIALRVLPKQPDEFVCQSCFLVKNRKQIADKDNMFCRDCV